MKKLGNRQVLVVVLVLVLLILLGGTYAYFSINASNDKTGARVTGKAGSLGNPTLKINTSKLYLNLDANLMSEANAGKTYYANENENGLALTTNPNYTLATAQLPEGDEALDCTYNYKVTASVTTPITDNSDNDVKVVVGDKTMTLKELTTAGTTGIIVSGEIKNLTKGQSVSIPLTSSVTNTANTQDKLVGNSYTIKIEPYTSGDTKAFSCKVHKDEFAKELIESGNLWQSGLEGDGYRYAGSDVVRELNNPNNFICFGTTDSSECINNQDKYMYRIIGVFADSNGNNHVKLIKYKKMLMLTWDSSGKKNNWGNSTLYKSLNGDEFLTNATYDYLQNDTWSNKIENWTWTTVNTFMYPDASFQSMLNATQIYLQEMNRDGKSTTISIYSTVVGKIGLMYVSDYALSLGEESLKYLNSSKYEVQKKGWLHASPNYTPSSFWEWTISANWNTSAFTEAWAVYTDGKIDTKDVGLSNYLRPVFYLTSNIKVSSNGDGSIEKQFMIEL